MSEVVDEAQHLQVFNIQAGEAIALSMSDAREIAIYNMQGELLMRPSNGSQVIEIGHLDKGSYIITLRNSNGERFVSKFVRP